MIEIPQHIKKLVPYKAGKPIEELAREKGLKNIVKLASNENPLGPSPKAIEEIKRHLLELHRYIDPSNFNLNIALSKKYNKNPEHFICGSGSDSLLQYIIAAFTNEGDETLTSEGTFIGWYVNINKLNRVNKTVPFNNYYYDLNAIAKKITPKTKIVYLANPNNPTGTMFSKNEFENFLLNVPQNVLIVLDEAYTMYSEDLPDVVNGLMYELPNLIITRTLSKAYGLAGLRVGFAYGPQELIHELYKVKLPFEPNHLAEVAAIAALDDEEFIKQTKKMNQFSLNKFREFFEENNIVYIETAANFYLFLLKDEIVTSEFVMSCMEKGLILRHVKNFGIPNGIRINSGNEFETEFAIEVMSEVLDELKIKSSTNKQVVK
ncbi:MAG TPA: histidinol-phosphate transaminase [Ignavibacteriaceae bacterium]|nr:histidinol-phosphate transaminase [Ignavibacteriaceae bacterium]